MARVEIRLKGSAISKIKRALGVHTDGEFAEVIGMDRTTVSHIKAGKRAPSRDFMAVVLYQTERPFDEYFEVRQVRSRGIAA